jgi:hypothetical protein
MPANITPNVTRATVSVVKARASVSVVAPVAGVVVAVPVALIDYILIVPSAYADTTGRFKYVVDSVVLDDAKGIAFTKAVTDALSVSDSAPVLDVTKGLTESVTMSDSFSRVLVYIRNFADSASITDAKAFTLTKALTETATISESAARSVDKSVSDE